MMIDDIADDHEDGHNEMYFTPPRSFSSSSYKRSEAICQQYLDKPKNHEETQKLPSNKYSKEILRHFKACIKPIRCGDVEETHDQLPRNKSSENTTITRSKQQKTNNLLRDMMKIMMNRMIMNLKMKKTRVERRIKKLKRKIKMLSVFRNVN